MKEINKDIFRLYDIRGEYETQLDIETAKLIGRAYGTKILSLGRNECVIGHDNRLSSEPLTNALIDGIVETGVNVLNIGLVTTPMFYFACMHLNVNRGIMVTASHNPVNDNGFKIIYDDNNNACGDDIVELYNIINSHQFKSGKGSISQRNIKDEYVKAVLKDIKINKKLKVVIDPANAAGSIVVHDIFDNENIEAIYINDISDGSFPNHHPDPSVPANMEMLINKVLEVHADVGLAYDGDADRLGLVDDTGNIINIDTFMAIVWGFLMPEAKNKTAIFDVKCSRSLIDEIKRLGGIPYMYKTGNSYQKNKIKEIHGIFGGELSGHVYFCDKWFGFDDGIYATLRFLEILGNTNKTASELYAHLNKYYSTPEIKIHAEEHEKQRIVDAVIKYSKDKGFLINTIDGVRVEMERAWALVRASNTGPNLTLRFEAASEEELKNIQNEFTNLVNSINNQNN